MSTFHPYCLFNHIACVIRLDYVSAYSQIWSRKESTDLFFSMLTMVSVVIVLKCFTPVSKYQYMLFRAILLSLLPSKASPEQIPHNLTTRESDDWHKQESSFDRCGAVSVKIILLANFEFI